MGDDVGETVGDAVGGLVGLAVGGVTPWEKRTRVARQIREEFGERGHI